MTTAPRIDHVTVELGENPVDHVTLDVGETFCDTVTVQQRDNFPVRITEIHMDVPVGLPGRDGKDGATDYEELTSKPSIEGTTLTGNKTFEDLGLRPMTLQEIDAIIYG